MNDSRRGSIDHAAAALVLALGLWPGPLRAATPEDLAGGAPTQPTGVEPEEFGDLDLEQLRQVKVISAALTATPARLVPAKTTVLDETAIAQSGARHLDELLEIAAPNTQLILHNTHLQHFGIRGIISDRDDKYLLLVNGRVMNNRFFVGAESERDLPLLGDLRSVTLVHGPASATYGAGALAGALNLETHNGLTFEGLDARVRQILGDTLVAGELRFGHAFSPTSGVFLYAGVADQRGASQLDAPYVFGRSFDTLGATPDVVSGRPVTFPVPNLNDGGGSPKLKFHASYVYGSAELWARFTQGGGVVRPMRTSLQTVDFAKVQDGRRDLNRQFIAGLRYKLLSTKVFTVEAFASYDWYQHVLWLHDSYPDPEDRNEQEALGRVLATWTPNDSHSVALGLEFSHMWFSGPRLGFGTGPGIPPLSDSWQTNTVSLLGEHQWRLGDHWATFESVRVDKQTYTDWLISPRLALAFMPSARDTLKLIGARALRRSGDGELRQEYVQTHARGSTESLTSLELRYERQHDAHWHLGLGVFLEQNDAIGFDAVTNRSSPVGTFRLWGLEPELTFRQAKTRVTLSHGFTKLFQASLATPETIQGISAGPYGYGMNLANWANNITKIMLVHDLNGDWAISTSLRAYWGVPGARDLADWNGAQAQPRGFALADPGYAAAYGPSVFWNVGVAYRQSKHLTVRLDAFNVLGLVDKRLNKRIYYFRGSDYSSEAASLSLSAKLAF